MYFVRLLFFAFYIWTAASGLSLAQTIPWREQIDRAPEWAELDLALRRAWYAHDIDSVEQILSASPDRMTPYGEPEFGLAFRSLEAMIGSGSDEHPAVGSDAAARLRNWRARFPSSALPDIVEAMYLLHHADSHDAHSTRGRGAIAGFDPAQSARQEAGALVARASSRPNATPYWHTILMRVAITDREAFEILLERALAVRAASRLYFEPQRILLTHLITNERWHSTNIETLIVSLATREDGAIDPTIYARAYIHLFDAHFHTSLFERMPARWGRLREGLRSLTGQFSSPWLLNARTAIACLAGDQDETRLTIRRIETSIDQKLWRLPRFYTQCQDWAFKP